MSPFAQKMLTMLLNTCQWLIMTHNLTFQLNGINTQGENIADVGGLKESFKVRYSFFSKIGPE